MLTEKERRRLRLKFLMDQLPPVRNAKVQEMRQLIAEGKLETPERLGNALRGLAQDLGIKLVDDEGDEKKKPPDLPPDVH